LNSQLEKQKKLKKDLNKFGNMIRGTITTLCARCSRSNCICLKKTKSVAHRLTYKSEGQKSKIVYVSPANLKKVKKLVLNYKKFKETTEALIMLNIDLLKEGLI